MDDTAWVTKYSLTAGIERVEARLVSPERKMIAYKVGGHSVYQHSPHWHLSIEQAVAQAEKMQQRKLKALRASIAKIEAIKFR